GWLPPLDNPPALLAWYERHISPNVPDDLSALWSRGKVADTEAQKSSATFENVRARFENSGRYFDERGRILPAENSPPAPMLDLEAAVVEMRGILGQDIAQLKQTHHGDTARGVLLRHVQQTSDSLCRLENTLAGLRREKKDALPWAVFEEGLSKILDRLIDI